MSTSDFLILQSEARTTKIGKPYYALVLRTSQNSPLREQGITDVPAKVWSTAINNKAPLERGRVIAADFKEDDFGGDFQLVVNKYVLRDSSYPKELFLPKPAVDQQKVYEKLFKVKWLTKDMQFFFDTLDKYISVLDPVVKQKLFDIPAGARNHHSRRAGLLQHIEEMWDFAIKLLANGGLPHFEGVLDEEVLLASILLHDLGKVQEYNSDTYQFEETRVGAYLGHTCWSAFLVQELWPEKGDRERMWRLIHAILAHHGSQATGAAVNARTPEAVVIHLLDSLSARLDVYRTAVAESAQGKIPSFSKMLASVPVTKEWPPQ